MPDGRIQVTVAYSPAAREVLEVRLTLAAASTVAQALSASGFETRFAELRSSTLRVGVWNKKAELTQLLRDRDRVELYRALTVDPKVARRQRFAKQGAKKAGLFSNARPTGKMQD